MISVSLIATPFIAKTLRFEGQNLGGHACIIAHPLRLALSSLVIRIHLTAEAVGFLRDQL